MIFSIITGLAAGSLHVVSGADHLVAMVPRAFRKPRQAITEGLAWGLGHSTGVLILSLIAILFKDWTHLEKMSSLAEFCVGISLLIIGVFAVRASLGLNIHKHIHSHVSGDKHEHFHFHLYGNKKHNLHHHASASLGIIHGLAGAGHLLAVFPALALPALGALSYVISYLIGSIATMTAFVSIVSFATFRSSQRILPWMFRIAGILSIVTGIIWLQKTSVLIL